MENQTLEELTVRLLIEEERMKSLEGASALAVRATEEILSIKEMRRL